MVQSRQVKVGDALVSIDYMSSYAFDHLCVFTIQTESIATVYLIELDERTAHMQGRKFLSYLLANLPRATLLRQFQLAKNEEAGDV